MYFRIFDCWRLLAALLVMTYHFLYWAPGGAAAEIAILYRLQPLLDMFFMISGFFITSRYASRLNSLSDYGSFLRRRVARLYPLHLLTTLFFLLAALYAWSLGAENYPYAVDFANLPYHLLGIHALGITDALALNYVSWSVSAEFFSYAMFPVIIVALRIRGIAGLAGLIAAYLLVLEVASRQGVFPSGHWTSADTFGAYRAFADFMVGGLLARVVAADLVALRSPLPGIVLMAVAVIGMLMMVPWYVSFAVLVLSLYLSAVAETRNPDSTKRLAFAMPVTAAAFGIYIWHPVFEFIFLRALWDRWLVDAGWISFYVFMLVPMAISILVAVLSFRYLEPRMAHYIIGPRPAGHPRSGAVPTA
ncbi:acyltransferase [Fulvimarina sp. 2208YS6-2-32]|uniref:Acyltransferase n=1 Tax=Fulvimarina uroteuthidis TaxID=3098149 RepID=A0ABU5I0L6_9HYPH|nr:acyltransferase [Fulvimarina sp. 2208YS6-2-32]MDY8108354.1 acyltransferase [Fulvimarina sp. 2208YS6-2-32]